MERKVFSPGHPDVVTTVVKAGINLLPYIGGPMASILSDVIPSVFNKRVEVFLNELSDRLHALEMESDAERFTEENVATLAISALKQAGATHSKEKRSLLQNIFIGHLSANFSFNRAELYLSTMEQLTELHVALLKAFTDDRWVAERLSSSNSAPTAIYQTLRHIYPNIPEAMIDKAIRDLDNWGISNNVHASLRTTMTTQGAKSLEGRLTEFGQMFVDDVFSTSGSD